MALSFIQNSRFCIVRVQYNKDEKSCFRDIFLFGCPVLEDLVVKESHVHKIAFTYEIFSATLKTLHLEIKHENQSSEFSHINSLKINAPSLEYLTIEEDVSKYYYFENLRNLIEANVKLHIFPCQYTVVFGVIQALQNAKFLKFSGDIMQWPGSFCDSQEGCCYPTTGKPAADFGIHGLWPNYNNGSYPSNCDPNSPFDPSKVASCYIKMFKKDGEIDDLDKLPEFGNLVELELEYCCCYLALLMNDLSGVNNDSVSDVSQDITQLRISVNSRTFYC